jgi:hypothetical protein
MTSERDPEALIRAFLANGPRRLDDDVYEAIKVETETTHQLPRVRVELRERVPAGTAFVASLAAILVVSVVGLSLVGLPFVGPGSQPTPEPTPSASAASGGPPEYGWPRPLVPGTYTTSFVWGPDLRFTFTVPDGWDSRDINVRKNDRVTVQFYLVENAPTEVCADRVLEPAIGSAPDAIATALERLADVTLGPRSATFDDRTATYLEFTAAPPTGCAPTDYHLLKLPRGICGEGCGGLGASWKGLEFGGAPERNRLWILHVGRGSVVVNAVWTADATGAELAELQGVIDSISFETPNATPPPEPVASP